MNLCLDARPLRPHFPGIRRYIQGLVRALPAELETGDRIHLLVNPRQSLPDWVAEVVRQSKGQVIEVSASPFSLAQQWQIPRQLRRIDPDIYHSFTCFMPYRLSFRTILAVHDLIPIRLPRYVSIQARLFFRVCMYLALHTAQRVIANSEATRRDFLDYFHLPQEKVTAVPLGVEDAFRPPNQQEIKRVRSKYTLPDHYILYLGSNKPHKNLPQLVKAWARIAGDHRSEDFKLVIAGNWDPRYPQARQLTSRLDLCGSISFLGPIPDEDLPGVYGGARLFIFPSLFEGFGLPVLEAMACGTAVACSRTSSLPEVAENAAVYFDPLDLDEIAGVLPATWNDSALLRDLRERGLARAGNFSWRRTARQTIQIYREVRGRA